MRRQDKAINMKRANKNFQERINIENGTVEETRVIYHMADLYPNLSKKLKGL